MQKSAPSVGRVAIMAGFALSCFGLLLFLWLAFGGAIPFKPKGYRINASFSEATQLAVEADVRISGVPVGKVKSITPVSETGRSEVVIQLESKFAPLPSDVQAQLRQKTLLGETYVELTPGTETAPKIPEEGRIADTAITESVELDEIFRAFDPRTRKAFQSWMQNQALAAKGHGRDLSDALGNLGPFAEDAAELVSVLDRQEGAVKRVVRDTGEVFEALTERGDQLADMITNLNTVFKTTAERDQQLQEAFIALPTFQRESRTTLTRLSKFARDTDPLITQLRPAARELSPTLADLEDLAPDARAFFRELGPLIEASKKGFPAAEKILDDLRPLLRQIDPALRQLIPILEHLGLYKRELTSFFANVVASTQSRDVSGSAKAPIHYLRTMNPVNAENLAAYPRRIGTNRPLPYALPGAFDKLATGLEVNENRHCGRGVPVISQFADPVLDQLVPDELQKNIEDLFLPVTSQQNNSAPPCKLQEKFTVSGETTRYPRLKAQP